MALFLRKGQVDNMNQTYMKEQKILPLLLKMSLPMVISMMVNSLYNIVDSFFVAKISENAMTALSLVFPVQNLISSVMIGFAIGINAVISFFMGAQNQKQADKAASQGMLLKLHTRCCAYCYMHSRHAGIFKNVYKGRRDSFTRT